MRHSIKLIIFFVTWATTTICFGQAEIKNISFSFQSEREVVIINYFLDLKKSKNISNVNVFMSRDGGATFQKLKNVTGDIGTISTSGNKQIVFDVFKEFGKEEISGNFQFKVEGEVNFNSLDIEMVFVKGGTFTMGCTSEQGHDCIDMEKPSHKVTLSSYYIGKYEVTQAQWKAVMGNNPSYNKEDKLPVENVSWNDVQEFIKKLNDQTGQNYRLPTEAEWEYAARGGQNSKGYKFSGSNNINDVAWIENNSQNQTHSVGTKFSNELGIYDMTGNVSEWCSDFLGNYTSSAQTKPTGPSSGSYRVLRGGSWSCGADYCRVSFRSWYYPDGRRFSHIGFRLVLSL